MVRNEYKIVDDFQVKDCRVLVLDSEYEFGHFDKAIIEGKDFLYTLNSIKKWVIIKSFDCFKGKTIKFVSDKNVKKNHSEAAA